MTQTITSAMYQLTTGDCIKRLADDAFIPPDPANVDFAQYTAWLDEGNTPDPAPAPPTPPAPPTAAEKLAAAGLTVEELKALLAS
jgi:hypothetical protein